MTQKQETEERKEGDQLFVTDHEAGSSGGEMRITDEKRSEPGDTIILKVYENSNELSYDLPFLRRQTVLDVKVFVGEVTGIPLGEQKWTGWPQGTNDESTLEDLGLDRAFHSLGIRRGVREDHMDPLEEENLLVDCEQRSNGTHCDSELMDIDLQPSSKRPRTDVSETTTILSPDEVHSSLSDLEKKISNKILQYLTPSEQLSLRRTSKTTHAWVTRKQKDITLQEESKWKGYQLVITGNGLQKFGAAAGMGLPITKFTFEVKGESFYEDEHINDFLTRVGPRVKDLTLENFFTFQHPTEYRMLQAFENLEKLSLNNLVENSETSSRPANACPSTLKNLQVLKLNFELEVPQIHQLIRPLSWNLTWGMLQDCQKLNYLRFPRVYEENPDNSVNVFDPLMGIMEERLSLGDHWIETLDLKNLNDLESLYVHSFLELLRNCHAKGIKFQNVNSELIQQGLMEEEDKLENDLGFFESIVSLVNFQHFVEMIPLPNLEKMVIDVVPSATDLCTAGRCNIRQTWPKLETIKVKDTFFGSNPAIQSGWERIEEGLYSGISNSLNYIVIDSPQFPYFLSESPRFADKFSSVSKLKISSWFGDDDVNILNKRLLSIWNKLRLVELHIERCPKLNDQSFTGRVLGEREDDNSAPSFLKLAESLKKFTLVLDDMSITDLVFIHVFSQMKFKVFKLITTEPVHISEDALATLMNGQFGRNIERFPFDCWTSSVIAPDRFALLGKEFRSMC